MALSLTDSDFDKEVIQSQLPVLVDFWAPWCGPCKMIAPHIDELSKELDGKLKICKFNVEEAQIIATRYQIMSVPTIMVFKEGKVMEKRTGVLGREDLRKLVNPYL